MNVYRFRNNNGDFLDVTANKLNNAYRSFVMNYGALNFLIYSLSTITPVAYA